MDNYRTIFQYGEDEIIINKSKFIGYAKPVRTEEEALEFIDEIKQKHRDATHNVSAYVLGENSNIQRFNDDGEPSGTAGIPMLEVIKKEDLRNTVLVATRYFGGIKLGGGGLIRAYTKTAKIGLDAAKVILMKKFKLLKLEFEYTILGKLENYLLVNGYKFEGIEYGANINMTIYVDDEVYYMFEKQILDLSNGSIIIEVIGEDFLPTKDNNRMER